MKLIFNKYNAGREEMQEYFSHISGTLDFSDLKADVEVAQEDLFKYVGEKTILRAVNFYYSNSPDPDISGSGGEWSLSSDQVVDFELLRHVQRVVTLMGYREFALNNDATHTKTGRLARMDRDMDQLDTKLIDRDDMALQRKAQKALDSLINFCEKNKIAEYLASDVKRGTRDLLLWNSDWFERYYPIEKSSRLFTLLVPMIRKAQVNHIAPAIGETRLALLLDFAHRSEDDASGSGGEADDLRLLMDKVGYPLAYYAIADGFKDLPVQLFPESMSRQFWNAGNGLAFVTLRDKVITTTKAEGQDQYQKLLNHIESLEAQAEGEPITDDDITSIAERMDSANKFVRV